RGLTGPQAAPAPRKPMRLAAVQTAGWAAASPGAKVAFADACDRLRRAGVEVMDRTTDAKIETFEQAIAGITPKTIGIQEWETRWPLATYRRIDASKVSRTLLDRL